MPLSRTPDSTPAVVYLQHRPHKAGAQTCLWRLLVHTTEQGPWHPVLVTSRPGWLVDACRQENIPVIVHPFPSSRSWSGRLYQNRRFATAIANRLATSPLHPLLVHGNDHQEGLLTLALAKRLQVPAALFLRDSAMTRRDYLKYQCPRCQFVAPIGQALHDRVTGWDSARPIPLMQDGILSREVLPPKARPAHPPERLLVIGSPLPAKGWADVVAALQILENSGVLRALQVDFTGDPPTAAPLALPRASLCRLRFLGRVNDFQSLVRRYDLVLNPSHRESFGMAAVEVLAAGVALLSSRTGIIEQVIDDPHHLYPPGDVSALAARLSTLYTRWSHTGLDLTRCQAILQNRFHIQHTLRLLTSHYQQLGVVQGHRIEK